MSGISEIMQSTQAAATKETEAVEAKGTSKTSKVSGKTIGKPQLSEKATKYYDELQKKFGGMDFVLVSRDMKEQAKAMAGGFANPYKMIVLIDEDKIERMAEDEAYRKKYEGIIANASTGLAQMKSSLESTGAPIQGYGMQVNDNGMTSFFAVLEKSSEAQKERIEKKAEAHRQERKAEQKKAQKEAAEERLEKGREASSENTVTITANSLEELQQKIADYMQMYRSDTVISEAEKNVGQNIDFSL